VQPLIGGVGRTGRHIQENHLIKQKRISSMRSWIKAGVIGAVVEILVTLLSRTIYFIPQEFSSFFSRCICIPFFLIYFAIGFLAAHWMIPPRTVRKGGIAGGLAILLAGIIDGVFSMFLDITIILSGITGQTLQLQLSPEKEKVFASYIGILICWRLIWLIIGVLLGWLGGMVCVVIERNRNVQITNS
jgi:hypothetical protein